MNNPAWRVCGDAWGSLGNSFDPERDHLTVEGVVEAPDAASASRLMRGELMLEGHYTWVSWQSPPLVEPLEEQVNDNKNVNKDLG